MQVGRLEGKPALISGAARGIGAATAMTFAREGACVVIADILDDLAAGVVDEIVRSGGRAIFTHLDVTDERSWRFAIDAAVDAFGGLRVLVNNAGIFLGKGIESTSVDEWDRLMAVNMKGVFLGTRAAIPAMRRSGGGSIINLSSAAGLVGNAAGAAYSASKGGVRLLTKSTALEYAGENIRCNSVHPGPIDTDLLAQAFGAGASTSSENTDRVPMRRSGQPNEVAYAILFLASDESSYMTGSELVVDGGRTAQ